MIEVDPTSWAGIAVIISISVVVLHIIYVWTHIIIAIRDILKGKV